MFTSVCAYIRAVKHCFQLQCSFRYSSFRDWVSHNINSVQVPVFLHPPLYDSSSSSLPLSCCVSSPQSPCPQHHHRHFILLLFLGSTVRVQPWPSVVFPKSYYDLGSKSWIGGIVFHKDEDRRDSRPLLAFRMGLLPNATQFTIVITCSLKSVPVDPFFVIVGFTLLCIDRNFEGISKCRVHNM